MIKYLRAVLVSRLRFVAFYRALWPGSPSSEAMDEFQISDRSRSKRRVLGEDLRRRVCFAIKELLQ